MKNSQLKKAGQEHGLLKHCAAWVLLLGAFCINAIAQVAIGGQISAAHYFEEKVMAQTGKSAEVAPDGLLPVDRYHDFQTVVLAEAISQPSVLDETTSWNSAENQKLVREFVKQGGTLVIFDTGFPIIREDSVTLADFSDLFGFENFDNTEQGAALVHATDEGKAIFSDSVWETGLQFPPWHSPRIGFPAENGLFAEVLLRAEPALEDGGKEAVFGTRHSFGKGKVYWFRWSPMRLRYSLEKDLLSPEASDFYEQSLANIFGEKY